jgi:hypothetical protein
VLNHQGHKGVFDRAAEGGTRATTPRAQAAGDPERAACAGSVVTRVIGLHGRPTGRTRLFVIFVTFVVETFCVGLAVYAPNA